jgi:hypothetical protein
LGIKKPLYLQSKAKTADRQGLTKVIEGKKTYFLLAFSVIYGLIFINYIDIITNGGAQSGYHMWLVLMYFLPFATLSIFDIKNWKLTIGLGLVVSLMNDVFYGAVSCLMGRPMNLANYYSLWLIPQSHVLFNLNLGFTVINVQSWMMASTIYLRLAAVVLILGGWKYIVPNLHIPEFLTLRQQKAGNLKPVMKYEPEMHMIATENVEIEDSS